VGVSAKRAARIDLTVNSKGMDPGVNDAKRKLRTFEREQARAAKAQEKSARKSVGNIKSGVAQGIGQAIGLDGIEGIKAIVSDVADYERALTRLQITADKSPEVMRAFSDQVMAASNATGLNRKDILDAASAYVALTGDMKTAQESTATWAKIAQATGTPIADISSTAAAMSQQLGITSGDMEAAFSGLAAQGKAGAIELKDLAGLMSQIAPMWGQFKDGKGAAGIAKLGAALQIVKRGFGGDAGETVTGLQSLLVSLQKNAGRFEGAGVEVFDVKDGKKTMKDVFSIIDAISKSKLVNDPEAMEKAFGRVEAYRAYIQLSQNRDALNDLANKASDAGLIQRDFDTYMASSAGRMERAWTQVKNAVAAAFTPERIEQFAQSIEGLAGALAPLIEGLGKIGDLLNGINHFGQEISGAITGDGEITATDRILAKLGDQGAQTKIDNLKGVADYATIKAADDPRARKFLGIKAESSAELAGQYAQATGPGAVAKRTAAEKFYKENGMDGRDPWAAQQAAGGQAAPVQPLTPEAAKTLASAIVTAIHAGFEKAKGGIGIKIGNEPIQKAAANSMQHRRGH
jgi:TP901 family phage tail tape measure protein